VRDADEAERSTVDGAVAADQVAALAILDPEDAR
jgi:hypothetical protein